MELLPALLSWRLMATSKRNQQFQLLINVKKATIGTAGHKRRNASHSETARFDLVIRLLWSIYQSGRLLLVLEKK